MTDNPVKEKKWMWGSHAEAHRCKAKEFSFGGRRASILYRGNTPAALILGKTFVLRSSLQHERWLSLYHGDPSGRRLHLVPSGRFLFTWKDLLTEYLRTGEEPLPLVPKQKELFPMAHQTSLFSNRRRA